MKITKTLKNERGSKMNTVIKDGREYTVEEVGTHEVKCKNPSRCLLPARTKYIDFVNAEGEEVTKRIRIHKVTAHTLYTPINN